MVWLYGICYGLIILASSVFLEKYAVWIQAIASLLLAAFLFTSVKSSKTSANREVDSAPSTADTTRGRMFEPLFANNPNAVCILDAAGNVVQVNATGEQILGYIANEIHNVPMFSFVAEEHLPTMMKQLDMARTGSIQRFSTAIAHKYGYKINLKATVVPIMEEGSCEALLFIYEDVTDRKRFDEQIRHMSFYDDMTGLPNRRLFREQLATAMRTASNEHFKVAVMFVDVDSFRLINESFGFEHGNMLLMQLAERLTHCIEEHDLIARSEGDQFSLCYTQIRDLDDAMARVSAIKNVMEQPFVIDQQELHLTVGIGIAMQMDETSDADVLMKNANTALTRVKDKERNGVQVFNAEMESMSLQRLKLESELRRALSQGEFVLHYQPQADISNGTIVGMEALIRWKHPERGMIPPKDFIPFAEETGLIVPIGEWAMFEACRQNKYWQDCGLPHVPVSVNLSIRQFMQPNIKDMVSRVLQQTGLEPRFLELEITESMTMDVENAIHSLLELKNLGVRVSIDDFGTGYSSLSYLKKFPIDKLKIDRSFVRDIMIDPSDAAIVMTIIAMTRHLNLKVIAEGVETVEQLNFLHQNQCNEVQGYWLSPPIEADRMTAILSDDPNTNRIQREYLN